MSASFQQVTASMMAIQTMRDSASNLVENGSSSSANIAMFAPHKVLQPEEELFLIAVEKGDLDTVKTCLEDDGVKIGVTDFLGRTAIELAVEYEMTEVLQYLMQRATFPILQNALKTAVSKDNVKITEIILSHPVFARKSRMALGESVYKNEDDGNTSFASDMSPLMIAAQRNNFQIIKLLIQKGNTIRQPHEYFCTCIECKNQRELDSVQYSKTRLNAYRALASAAYMALSEEDPIYKAFTLSAELDNLATIEKEYKSEYMKLSQKCRDFAVELLDLCRTTDEVMAILDGEESPHPDEYGVSQHSLITLKLAIRLQQKKFIAHSACQRQLLLLWYHGTPWLRYQHFAFMFLQLPLLILFYPFMILFYLVYPRVTPISRIMRTPFVKFVNAAWAYVLLLFMILLDASLGGDKWAKYACGYLPFSSLIPSLLILVWIIGTMFTEARELYNTGPKIYIGIWWNILEFLAISLYYASYALRFTVYGHIQSSEMLRAMYCDHSKMTCDQLNCLATNHEANVSQSCRDSPDHNWDVPDPSRIADIFYGLASMISFARIAYLLPASEELGPLLVSFGKMLRDVVRVIIIMTLIFFAFLSGLTSVYQVYECENTGFSTLIRSGINLFWAIYTMGDTQAPVIDRRSIIFGIGDRRRPNPYTSILLTEVLGYSLFGVYIMANAIILINLLIAMMSNSFQEIYNDKDVEWKFARSELWIVYFEDSNVVPAPFNLIPNLARVLLRCRRRFSTFPEFDPGTGGKCQMRGRAKSKVNGQLIDEKKPVTSRLVKRYIHKKQFLDTKEDEDLMHIIRDVQDNQKVCNDSISKNMIEINNLIVDKFTSMTEELQQTKDLISEQKEAKSAADDEQLWAKLNVPVDENKLGLTQIEQGIPGSSVPSSPYFNQQESSGFIPKGKRKLLRKCVSEGQLFKIVETDSSNNTTDTTTTNSVDFNQQ